jgi:hypothetical protein
MDSSNTRRRRIRTADEQDALTRWRTMYVWCFRAGARKDVKRRANRAERREAKAELREDPDATAPPTR